MSVDGGSTSPLLGSFFMGMSEAVGGSQSLDGPGSGRRFRSRLGEAAGANPGQAGRQDHGRRPRAGRRGLATGGRRRCGNGRQLLAEAADAAQRGAEKTSEFQARFGRARNLGPRTIGHVDPGATSIALLFAGFRDGMKSL